jgi:hypothetical protein
VNDDKKATNSSELVAIFGTMSTVGEMEISNWASIFHFRFYKTRNCIGPDKSLILINFEIKSNLA